MEKYNPNIIEPKWQKIWEEKGIFSPDLDASTSLSTKKPFYNLMMFPYPSAEGLHVGNMYAFTGSDIYGRFKRMQGFSVFEPIGLDGFGIHSENYALKVGRHPLEQAKVSEQNFYRQLRATGNGYDWTRTLETYDPDYYKWTQWIFIQLFKAGLAYRKRAPVNFCPSCLTVLADEQVIDGECERCSSIVEKRELEQWFFKITAYADRLLNGLSQIDWSEKVKVAQRLWIGKSEDTEIIFLVKDNDLKIPVITTRADTVFGATFIVLAPEHELVQNLKSKIQNWDEASKYIEEAKKKTEFERGMLKDKTGVALKGIRAINPVNNEEIPVYIADYVLITYGTGAIMGVPAHDDRDFDFAKKFGLPIIPVIEQLARIENGHSFALEFNPVGVDFGTVYSGDGKHINSGFLNGLDKLEAIEKMVNWLSKRKIGGKSVHFHLRDWLISRQRYWGPPIPMIYCSKCDWQPVSEGDLPVFLPNVKDWRPTGTGKSPLASVEKFARTKCPKCGGIAHRETDVSDTFLDSAWYFLRYPSTRSARSGQAPFDPQITKKWLPVEMYIGGAEHSVLHLMYARFLTMVFKDLGLIEFEEPFKKFYAHGLLIYEGAKMSKSRGNVIIPDVYIQKHGADTLRCYLMFLGPFDQGGDFRDTGIEGMSRFLKRVWRLVSECQISNVPFDKKLAQGKQSQMSNESTRRMNKTIKKVTEDIENLRYNTAIAALMEYYNFVSKQKIVNREEIVTFLKLLAPFAPYMAEELWSKLDNKFSVHQESWPKYDPKMLEEEEVTIVVQVDGKVRDSIKYSVLSIKNKEEVEKMARQSDRLKKYLDNKNVKKVIYVPGKIINFVVED